MKRGATTITASPGLIVLILLLISGLTATADNKSSAYLTDDGNYILSPSTTLSHFAIVELHRDEKGFMQLQHYTDIYQPVQVNRSLIYAYCPKTAELLYSTPSGNYSATATKELAKLLKKDKAILQLKIDEMARPKSNANSLVEAEQKRLNNIRQTEISDSIRAAELERKRLAELKRIEEHNQMVADYRRDNLDRWRMVPLSSGKYCDACGERHSPDSILLICTKSSQWIYMQSDDDMLHTMTPMAKSDNPIWFEAFADSLESISLTGSDVEKFSLDNIKAYNEHIREKKLQEAKNNLKEIAPWGFIQGWDWDDEYGMVTFEAKFVNTSDATIKYIEFHFVITNDVSDRRCSGVFKGTGPVEPWDSGRWVWDSSRYFVAGDASKMRINKVVLTYMNGKQRILSGDKLIIFDD